MLNLLLFVQHLVSSILYTKLYPVVVVLYTVVSGAAVAVAALSKIFQVSDWHDKVSESNFYLLYFEENIFCFPSIRVVNFWRKVFGCWEYFKSVRVQVDWFAKWENKKAK